jgi:hypothetical protein
MLCVYILYNFTQYFEQEALNVTSASIEQTICKCFALVNVGNLISKSFAGKIHGEVSKFFVISHIIQRTPATQSSLLAILMAD